MFFPRPRPVAPVAQQQMMPPRIHPTQQHVVHHCCEYIVPEVHPAHTTVVNEHLYKHYHNFPQTVSTVDQVANQHFMCPPGPVVPVPYPGIAPGMAPGMAPGTAPRRRFF